MAPVVHVACANSALLYSMDLLWLQAPAKSSAAEADGAAGSEPQSCGALLRGRGAAAISIKASSCGGGGSNSSGGELCLWVAAGSVFLTVLTWQFSGLTPAMLHRAAAAAAAAATAGD